MPTAPLGMFLGKLINLVSTYSLASLSYWLLECSNLCLSCCVNLDRFKVCIRSNASWKKIRIFKTVVLPIKIWMCTNSVIESLICFGTVALYITRNSWCLPWFHSVESQRGISTIAGDQMIAGIYPKVEWEHSKMNCTGSEVFKGKEGSSNDDDVHLYYWTYHNLD